MKKITLKESELKNLIRKSIENNLNINEQSENLDQLPLDEFDFELDDSDVIDINNYKGPTRRFRGSIYIDGLIPETEDREYDRKLALKLIDYYRQKLPTKESYVGGVGFKQKSLIEPFDNMDF